MLRVAVESTSISTIAYDQDSRMLEVQFRDLSIYQYYDVPHQIHNELLRASSAGTYFNREIRGRFNYVRLG